MKTVGKSQTVKILDSGDSVRNLKWREVWERKLWHCLSLKMFEGSYPGK